MKCEGIQPTFLFSLFLMSFSSVICSFIWSDCINASTYTDGSLYSTNLNRVINDLVRNTSQSAGFNTTSHGQSSNKVYGLLQCTGNISAEKCSDCSQQANNSVRERCGNNIGGEVWMDDCFLRYNNSNFISKLDTNGIHLWNTDDFPRNIEAYKSATSSLILNLSNEAYKPENKGFAEGIAARSTSDKLYGRVQCVRDISMQNCRTCLSTAWQVLENCCSRKQGAQNQLRSCSVRYEIYPFFDSAESPSPSPSPFSSPPTSTPPTVAHTHGNGVNGTSQSTSKKKSSKALPIILGLVGGIILAMVICLVGMRKRVKAVIFGTPVTLVTHDEERHGVSPESGLLMQEQLFIFSLEELAEATENFDNNNKLGEGGFGAVYKGATTDGKGIAVKKLYARSAQGKKQFVNELKLVANVQHRNLVKLLGCCVEGDERLLVYEYLHNKSLDTFLFDPEKSKQLDWQERYNIIIGVARGLLYLHEGSQLRIIHRDIKANNILLDDQLNPKIADFGLARLFPEDETHIETRIAGTYGYMAPEYAMRGHLSVKADVYAFGVLLLEIVSGRRNTDNRLPQELQNLLEWAWRLHKGGNVLNIVDSTVSETYSQEQALRCIHVGLLCVQADPTVRPVMSNVTMMISSGSVTLPNPTEPAFISWSDGPKPKSKSSSRVEGYEKGKTSQITETTKSFASGVPSVNEISFSQLDPR